MPHKQSSWVGHYMAFVNHFGCSEEEYSKQEQQKNFGRPGVCPLCRGEDCLIGHGYYLRKPKGMRGVGVIRIKRWLCKMCRRTISVLPDFLFPFRQYVVRVIQAVIEERFESKKSWAGVEGECACRGAPAMRTMQRWCASYAEQAPRWLGAAPETLTQQDCSSAWQDPHREALKVGNPEQALLSAK